MTTYTFLAQALTPIHIGSGREINPTEFVLKNGKLVHFNPAQLIGSLSPTDRKTIMGFLEKASIKEIQAFFQNHVLAGDPDHTRITVSDKFKREFEAKAANPNNQFRVEMMPRNPHTGRVYIPGSSIKGAIRTAVINHFANQDESIRQGVHTAVNAETNINKKSKVLEEKTLGRLFSETHRDIFRLIRVEDVSLPDDTTRIDQAVNWNPNKQGSENIQMWVERLKSCADKDRAQTFPVTIHLNTQAMKHPQVINILGRTLGLRKILKSCNQFYWGRMTEERDTFYGSNEGPIWKVMHGLFPQARDENGDVFRLDPSSPFWDSPGYQKRWLLLRIGHFSHFESLSVNNLRQGYNIQACKPIEEMGSSRTRCEMGNSTPPMPFGWLVLSINMDQQRQ